MATYQKRGAKWRAIVRKGGKSISKSFHSKVDAKAWAGGVEAEIAHESFVDRRELRDYPIGEALRRYSTEVAASGTKAHALARMARQFDEDSLFGFDVGFVLAFARKRRKDGASASTIQHDMVYLRGFCEYAQTVWKLPIQGNPVSDTRMQLRNEKLVSTSNERDRRLQTGELYALLGYFRDHWMADVIEFAIETAMRRGEICRVVWEDLDTEKRLLTIRDRKHPQFKDGNHQKIPLLGKSMEIIQRQPKTDERIFPYVEQTITNLFRKACREIPIDDLRLHDLRHEGISRLFEQGYRIEQVSLVSGHKDWSQLRRYTNLRPESLHDGP